MPLHPAGEQIWSNTQHLRSQRAFMCHIQFFITDFRCGVYMQPHAGILVYPGLGSLFVVYTDDSVIFIGPADYIISTAEKEATSLSDCRDTAASQFGVRNFFLI